MKKNKKMFAILTLVAFMMTLVPALAFADATTISASNLTSDGATITLGATPTGATKVEIFVAKTGTDYETAKITNTGADVATKTAYDVTGLDANTNYKAKAVVTEGDLAGTTEEIEFKTDLIDAEKEFAAKAPTAGGSDMYVEDTTVNMPKTTTLTINLDGGKLGNEEADKKLIVWSERNGALSDAVTFDGETGSVEYKAPLSKGEITIKLGSNASGTETIKAAIIAGNADLQDAKDGKGFNLDSSNTKIVFKGATNNANIDFKVTATDKGGNAVTGTEETGFSNVPANSGVQYYKVTAKLTRTNNGITENVKDQEVVITVDKDGATASKETAKVNGSGVITFNLSADKAGTYTVTLDADGDTKEVKFTFGTASIGSVTWKTVPEKTIAVKESFTMKLNAFDANGNQLTVGEAASQIGTYKWSYTSVPSDSSLDTDTEGDITAVAADKRISFAVKPDVAGDYKVKVYNNDTGKSIYTEFTAAKIGTITEATVEYDADSVALGATVAKPTIKVSDASGVEKEVSSNIKLSYAGKGVKSFSNDGSFTVEKDDKYVGEEIVVTAVYNNKVVANQTLTIADGVAALADTSANIQVDKETYVAMNSVDFNGNKAIFGTGYTIANGYATVTSKPDGAKVSVNADGLKDSDLLTKGNTGFKITSDKEGEIKVNAVIEVKDADNNSKFISGTATVTVGKEATPATSTATLIIGSNTFVANGKVVTSDVAPFIQNGRTFLPVRALAEALGASVEFDAATNIVTIKSDKVTATMTLGSTVMTVNDEVVTMDTAAFATAEGRTVVPVRYAAQALGYDVDITTNADGTTASVTLSK